MQDNTFITIKSTCLGILFISGMSLLFGCAPSQEFQTTPQSGALRTGVYPNFSVKPQAATEQLSAEDQQRLSDGLKVDGQQAQNFAYSEDKKQKNKSRSSQNQANQEIEDTLQHITNE